MKNKKVLFPALALSFMIMIAFMVVGCRVMIKYWHTPTDWHFIAASMGVAGFMLMFMVLFTSLIKKIRKEQNVQESRTYGNGS